MRRGAALGSLTLAGAAAVLAGCSALLGGPDDPAPAPVPAVPEPVGEPRHFTECSPPYAFEGETTIAELGLADRPGFGPEATRRGTIRITEWTVTHEQFAPPGAPVIVPEGQLLCATWPDGSGMTMMLPGPFPPDPDEAGAEAGAEAIPLTPILVALAIAVVVAASWIAFRRAPETAGGG